jgi:hypothetical protein
MESKPFELCPAAGALGAAIAAIDLSGDLDRRRRRGDAPRDPGRRQAVLVAHASTSSIITAKLDQTIHSVPKFCGVPRSKRWHADAKPRVVGT